VAFFGGGELEVCVGNVLGTGKQLFASKYPKKVEATGTLLQYYGASIDSCSPSGKQDAKATPEHPLPV